MAEPEKKIEIEDVLSSIRRLVAQDPIPPRSAPTPVAPLTAPEEALLLTQSDRVEDETPSLGAIDPAPLPDAPIAEETFDHVSPFASPAPDSAEFDAMESAEEAGFALTSHATSPDEASLDQDWEAVHHAAPGTRDAVEPQDMPFDTTIDEATDAALDVLQLEPHMRAPEPAMPTMPVTPASASDQGDFEPDEGDAAPLSGALTAFGHAEEEAAAPLPSMHFDAFDTGEDAPEPAEDASVEDAPVAAQTRHPSFATETGAEAETYSACIEDHADVPAAMPEPVMAPSTDSGIDPERVPDCDPAEESLHASAAVEAPLPEDPDLAETAWTAPHDADREDADWPPAEELPPELEAAAEALSDTISETAEMAVLHEATRRLHLHTPEGEITPTEEARPVLTQPAGGDAAAVFDEEALRQMVGRMIRAELQGALGEQITRKVRRLVRQEINRALIAREFD
ncbi:hypothetical protein [Thioclava sp. GXIMD4216]|uniref:hypothetical protein n=1 Tax=Thioclava sp. GXIMD4216 TaxID=3131929 RepID=UPI0030D54D36